MKVVVHVRDYENMKDMVEWASLTTPNQNRVLVGVYLYIINHDNPVCHSYSMTHLLFYVLWACLNMLGHSQLNLLYRF